MYKNNFSCKIKHQDNTWALIGFKNIQIALVTPGQILLILQLLMNKSQPTEIKTHRDGIHYIYFEDPDRNVIEKIDRAHHEQRKDYCQNELLHYFLVCRRC